MKLVEEGILSLDAPVDEKLKRWKPASSPLAQGHPVTLRWLLSMRAGVNVGGYIGYARGEPIPNLVQILNGTPPAASPRVEIVSTPGETYAYSGGGYEIVEALIADATGESFDRVAKERVFDPVGMTSSVFGEPLPPPLLARAATGHSADGSEVPGGWRVLPELAAAGLWSTPEDLAHLLTSVADSFRGRPDAVLTRTTVEEMLTPQGGGPYGLGAAVTGSGQDVSLRKRGQNVGYQGYLILFPARGEGLVVMTGSDNGSILADALIRRAAQVYGWPAIGPLPD
jgi:CubicO group peptidase (beta-lactamase class C family)